MRHDKLSRELDLLLLMTENKTYTAQELCDRLNMSRRNLYYYLDFFRESGFNVIKSGFTYRLDRHSPFFQKLHESIDFTEEEATLIGKLVKAVDDSNPLVDAIRRKLDKFYDLRILNDVKFKKQVSENISRLYEAIKLKHVVLLRHYSSPHSHTVSDRVVEPFLFMNDNMDVRCYEMKSGKNKTFKVTRMEQVEIVDALWSFESRHKAVFTDIFMFSGDERQHLRLLLGQLSSNILKEEYPQAAPYMQLQADGRWLLELDVASFLGIGRFVLGLMNDIEILDNEPFKAYLRQEIERMKRQMEA